MGKHIQPTGKRVAEIFETKDYSIFKEHRDNRIINQSHVKKLSEKMKTHGWLPTSRVVINEKGELIDGHHRVRAAVIAKVPVRYSIHRGANGDDITEMNTLQKNWSPFDHLHKWVMRGNPNYMTFSKFARDYPMFKYTEVSMLLNNNMGGAKRDIFESGNYVVKNEKIARQWAEYIVSLKPYFEKYYTKSIFVRAIIKVLSSKGDVFNFDEFLRKVKIRPTKLVPCGTVDQYVELIEDIYNYRRTEKVNLRF